MEELRGLIREGFAEIIQWFPNWRKLQNIRYELQLPLFDGKNPTEWILEMEEYFQLFWLSEEEEFRVACVALDGEAWWWFGREHLQRPFYRWEELKLLLVLHFGSSPSSFWEQPTLMEFSEGTKYQNFSLSHNFTESTYFAGGCAKVSGFSGLNSGTVMGPKVTPLDSPHMEVLEETKVTRQGNPKNVALDGSLSSDTSDGSGDKFGKNLPEGFGGGGLLGGSGGQGNDPKEGGGFAKQEHQRTFERGGAGGSGSNGKPGGFARLTGRGGGYIKGEGCVGHGGISEKGGTGSSGSGGGPGGFVGGQGCFIGGRDWVRNEAQGGYFKSDSAGGNGYYGGLGRRFGNRTTAGGCGWNGADFAKGGSDASGSGGGPGVAVGDGEERKKGGKTSGGLGGFASVTSHRWGSTRGEIQRVLETTTHWNGRHESKFALEKNPEDGSKGNEVKGQDNSDWVINLQPHDFNQNGTPEFVSKGSCVFFQGLGKRETEGTCIIFVPPSTNQLREFGPTRMEEKRNLGSAKRNERRPTLESFNYQPKFLPTAFKPNHFPHLIYSPTPLSVPSPQLKNQSDPAHLNANPSTLTLLSQPSPYFNLTHSYGPFCLHATYFTLSMEVNLPISTEGLQLNLRQGISFTCDQEWDIRHHCQGREFSATYYPP